MLGARPSRGKRLFLVSVLLHWGAGKAPLYSGICAYVACVTHMPLARLTQTAQREGEYNMVYIYITITGLLITNPNPPPDDGLGMFTD